MSHGIAPMRLLYSVVKDQLSKNGAGFRQENRNPKNVAIRMNRDRLF
jgi:hypothetical protein